MEAVLVVLRRCLRLSCPSFQALLCASGGQWLSPKLPYPLYLVGFGERTSQQGSEQEWRETEVLTPGSLPLGTSAV